MKRRLDPSLLVSIALHLVFGAILVWVLSIPYPLQRWLQQQHQPVVPERIGLLRLPDEGVNRAAKRGGNGRPVERRRAPRPVVAPSTTPTALPTAPTTPTPAEPEPGTGPIVGAGGPTAGVTPSFHDPRLWLPPADVVTAPKSSAERVDSVWQRTFARYRDSMATVAANAPRDPHDWTFEKNGKKYGIDQSKIYLGKFAIPSAVLALLPLNKGANAQNLQDQRMREVQRLDIYQSAQRELNEEDFREAVKRIRERKDREHREQMQRKKKEQEKANGDTIAAP